MTIRENFAATILVVDDDPAALYLINKALKKISPEDRIYNASDGIETLAFLRKEGRFVNMPTPDLVLLDWNLPGVHGRDVMAQVSADPALKHIPVVVITTSKSEQDRQEAMDLDASGFKVKEMDFYLFTEDLRTIRDYHLGLLPEDD